MFNEQHKKESPILGLLGLGGGIARSGSSGFNFYDTNNIGAAVEGGFFAGLISQNANGTATHALIVAPKATGSNSGSGIKWKTSESNTSGTSSTYDGAANTANMNNSTHPAAYYCAGLTIDGYSDWYLPALYEMNIAYYHLKNSTHGNSTVNLTRNAYSVPSRASTNFTNSPLVPTQTSVSVFQLGGSEAFIQGATYWVSTQHSANDGKDWVMDSGSSSGTGKTASSLKVRAFRKVAL